ncbi:MAG: HAD family hydrolase [Porphyrobacter sp.]|nr:HAD family hydrolase [Porphyrobacter sp.]
MRVDWSGIKLVIFDVDGTLYDQWPLRLDMARALVADSMRQRSFDTIRILSTFRKVRENLGDERSAGVSSEQFSRTAKDRGCSEDHVRTVVERWIEQEPLSRLRRRRTRGASELFAALRRNGRTIAAWSDYPVEPKLSMLELQADLSVCSSDPAVNRFKPDPAGLQLILDRTATSPEEALVVGDRFDRDWEAARAISVPTLIRSFRKNDRSPTFRDFRDRVFAPVLAEAGHA